MKEAGTRVVIKKKKLLKRMVENGQIPDIF